MSQAAALRPTAVVALAVRVAVGVALVVAGWIGASGEAALDRQAPWLSLAVAGALVVATSGAVWVLGLRRAVRGRVLAVVEAVAALPEGPAPGAVADGLRVRRRGGGSLHHRPDCALVAGRAVEVVEPSRSPGLAACEACGA